jgi:hypothetical protein
VFNLLSPAGPWSDLSRELYISGFLRTVR